MPKTDAAKLPVMLTSLRLPTIARLWQDLGARADREDWGAARYLATLCEHEVQERHTRRIARRIASPEMLPDVGSLPHLICSPRGFGSGDDDEASEHGDAR